MEKRDDGMGKWEGPKFPLSTVFVGENELGGIICDSLMMLKMLLLVMMLMMCSNLSKTSATNCRLISCMS